MSDEIKEEETQSQEVNIESQDSDNPKEKKKKKKKSFDSERELAVLQRVKKQERKRRKKLRKIMASKEKIERIEADLEIGLNKEQIEERIDKGYVNEKIKNNGKSIKKIILSNIFTFFNILMIFIAGWLLSVGAIKDLFFMVIVTLNVIIGIVQEIRAKMTIDRLSILSAPSISVLREGQEKEIPTNDLVLDDIILLDSGKQIPSDSIVVSGSIEVNESLLTGESDAIVKKPGDKLFSGSYVVSGTCKARVDAVGEDNYIEKLTTQAKKYNKPKSELLASLNYIITFMAVIIIPIGAILFCMQYEKVLGSATLMEATRKTAGAMIGMIPSGLFLLTSIALAVGVMKLAQNNVLVQELYCIEMLARVDCLCLDKTGTITDGTMTVKNVVEYTGIPNLSVKNIVSAILNATNDTNMTSVALEQKFGRAKRLKSLEVIPFSSQRKFSAATFEKHGTFVMGAPEFVLTKNYNSIAQDVLSGAKLGYRVLLIAHTNEAIKEGKIDTNLLSPVALIYIEDTIRPDAIETIKYFKNSGVEVKVISGDNPITVSKVSERAGIENATEYISLDGLSDLEVIRAATKYTVFGRVSPAQKKLLVTTLKEAGKTVAMTGDGVNDILALKEADCSISVASGSDAARNVSHLVLLDNNFGSMPKVVAEGRRVINNVAKVAKLFLTKTIFSLLLAIYAINFSGNYPISTNQLIMIDLFCIGLPSFVLVLEPCNEKSTGNFLSKIIKDAVPGAIVILFNAVIVLALSSVLGLDKRDTSTLIVIIATFTCLMVLFETCKPWTLYKKFMYAFIFICCTFVIVLLPRFLDFTPLSNIGVYYDKTLSINTINEWPKVETSRAGYLVIDGEYTSYIYTNSTQSNESGKLKVGNQLTDYDLEVIPSYSLDFDDKTGKYNNDNVDKALILGGKITDMTYSNDLDVQVTHLGDVYVNGKNVKYNVLPTVRIGKNGNFIVNDIQTDIKSEVNTITSVNIYDYCIYINGESINYKIDPVTIGIYNEKLVVGGTLIDGYDYSLIDKGLLGINEAMEYTYDGVVLSYFNANQVETPYKLVVDVEVSDSGYYVIGDTYTSFKQSGKADAVNLTCTEDGYLKINDTVTDYVLDISTAKGGEVSTLKVSAILLLFLLCLLTTPLMTLFRAIVPWCRQLLDTIQKILGRM